MYVYYCDLGIHHHEVIWLTLATFTSRITMLSCFMFQVEDRASYMILTLSCHFPVLLTLTWKMPLSLMRTSIHSLEGEGIQNGFTYFLKLDLDSCAESLYECMRELFCFFGGGAFFAKMTCFGITIELIFENDVLHRRLKMFQGFRGCPIYKSLAFF